MGMIDWLFVEDSEKISKFMGKDFWMFDVLGKHSEFNFVLDEESLNVITEDQEFIKKFEELGCSTGVNPLEVIEEEEES